jgi:catechol 2,3-dioxygenase-like lactoylglutathione lyase family enzyme
MELTTGINHVAVVTGDLDRFIDFYAAVLDAELVFEETIPELGRHAMLRIGTESVLHPVEAKGSPHAQGLPAMMNRGHLDHYGITVASFEALKEIQRRLLERGATDGTITDFGPMQSVWFEDPDGMGSEVCFVRDASLRGIHGPQPYVEEVVSA